MPIIPSDAADKAAAAIVRQAESQKQVEQIAKQQAAMEKRRREEALREAEAAKRNQGTNQKK